MLAPWIISVYPTILTAKGVIAGLLAGRLGTALHIGTIYPRFTSNTRVFHNLFDAIIVVNLIASLLMSSISVIFGMFFWGIKIGNIIEIILNVIATMTLGLTISFITVYISFLSFRFGWDPDIVVYPVISSTADAIITIYYGLVITMSFLLSSLGRIIIVAIDIICLALVAITILRNIYEREFIKSIKEILLTLLIVAFLVNVTGTFLERISTIIEKRREIYTVYPVLIDMIGDVGSVIGSTATTRLALGLIDSTAKDLGRLKEHIFSSWFSSIIILTVLSAVSLTLNNMLKPPYFAELILILLIVDVIAIPLIIIISYLVSILTFRRGLDPDNFVIPIESSLSDNIATASLLLAILILR
ncbi:MAG: magnesium transporter [Candidatus Bathyarchaeia archaeon]